MNNIEAIIDKLERELIAINGAILALRGISGGPNSARTGLPTGQKRRGRPPKNPNPRPAAAAPTGGITEEGRRRLAESMRRRWKAKRAAEKKSKSN